MAIAACVLVSAGARVVPLRTTAAANAREPPVWWDLTHDSSLCGRREPKVFWTMLLWAVVAYLFKCAFYEDM